MLHIPFNISAPNKEINFFIFVNIVFSFINISTLHPVFYFYPFLFYPKV